MKKLAAIMLVLSLTACGAAPAAEPLPPAAAEAAPPVIAQITPEPREEKFCFAVETETYEDSAAAEDGTPLAAYRFDLPFLRVLREDGTELEAAQTPREKSLLAVAEAFNEHFGKWAAAEEFDGLVRSAEEDLAFRRQEGIDWFGGYALELTTSIYQTENMISVAGLYYSYTGGAHPNTWQLGWNFDLESGAFFGPEALAADGAVFQEAIHQELIAQADAVAAENGMKPEEFFWEDYREILANWGSYAVFFDESGMTVAYSPYELACYAAGPQVFRVSYEWLRPHLSEYGCTVLELE